MNNQFYLSNTPKKSSVRFLLPVWGIGLFIILYIMAAWFYPGGSDADRMASGFSWQHNYWCELLPSHAQNGEVNTARPVAISAMIVLAVSLTLFWYFIPSLFPVKKITRLIISGCGIGSMLLLPFLLTGEHDRVMNLAALLGCTAILVLLVHLFKNKMLGLFWLGVACLLLCGINNYVYYSEELLHHLPVIQKISFLVFLYWFVHLSFTLYKQHR